MAHPVTLELRIPIAASASVVWDAITDWPTQGQWMLGTQVWVTAGTGQDAGSEIAAFSGIGRLGFLDTMTITAWNPPRSCEVRHTGKVVRGTGWMGAEAVTEGSCEFVWGETLELPLGWLGRVGWIVVGPLMKLGVLASLRRFRTYVLAVNQSR